MQTSLQAGQESVWDYPRHSGAGNQPPPSYYIPRDDIRMEFFTQTARHTFCEFKGMATYWTIQVGEQTAENAAWSYETPKTGYESIRGFLSFYPGRLDSCYVGEEKVVPQEGDFYGGWITANIVGPFKGAPGTRGW